MSPPRKELSAKLGGHKSFESPLIQLAKSNSTVAHYQTNSSSGKKAGPSTGSLKSTIRVGQFLSYVSNLQAVQTPTLSTKRVRSPMNSARTSKIISQKPPTSSSRQILFNSKKTETKEAIKPIKRKTVCAKHVKITLSSSGVVWFKFYFSFV